MKLSEYIKKLQQYEKEYGHLKVIYSVDDEGNDFKNVIYSPSLGYYDGEEYTFEEEDEDYFHEDVNCICIN